LKRWGLARDRFERYVFFQPKLRRGTDSSARKSGLGCSHNILLLSEDTPPSESRKPTQTGFLPFLGFFPGSAGWRSHGNFGWHHLLSFGFGVARSPCLVPRPGLDPQPVVCRTGHGDTIHSTASPKQIEHHAASLPTSSQLRTTCRSWNRLLADGGNSDKDSLHVF